MQFFKRKIYNKLKIHLEQPEISLILGPRQAGKTTLMRHLASDLESKGQKSAYFNLDIIEDNQYFTSQHNFLSEVKKRIKSDKSVVFIDEVQRLKNAGLFLKGLYDLGTNYKFIVSGSGSLELKADIIEPMTGRKKVFYCHPLSFSEFTANKLGIEFDQVESNLSANSYERKRLINEYFTYGGYPRVVLANTYEEKQDILKEIYKSYLEKDIQLVLGVEKEEAFGMLVKILANQIGNIINRQEISSTLGISEKTVEKYLGLLEKTFVIYIVKPYFTNVRKELRKMPKVYFSDLGFLNLGRGGNFQSLIDGPFFENACYLRLAEEESVEPIHFWRSTSQAEIDFVMKRNKTNLVPIEVKMKSKVGTIGKSLISFLKNYSLKKAYIYTLEIKSEIEKSGYKIKYIPYHLTI